MLRPRLSISVTRPYTAGPHRTLYIHDLTGCYQIYKSFTRVVITHVHRLLVLTHTRSAIRRSLSSVQLKVKQLQFAYLARCTRNILCQRQQYFTAVAGTTHILWSEAFILWLPGLQRYLTSRYLIYGCCDSYAHSLDDVDSL